MQGSEQTTNQSSLELVEFKPEDQIQWVAGSLFLDYGDRSDIFRTGPDSVFNQAAVRPHIWMQVFSVLQI